MPTLVKQTETIAKLETEIRDLSIELRYLKRQLEVLKRKFFGSPASETISDEQMTLALAELDKEEAEQAASEKEVIGYARRKPKAAEAVARLLEDIETITTEILPQEVIADPQAYERVGKTESKQLDVIPMKFVMRVTVRPKFKLKDTLDAVPFVAPLPARLVPGGIPAAGLVAQVIVWKYADHMPLYRLEKILRERFGVRIPRQRMCDWIAYAVENWLSIIYRSIRNGLISGDYLQMDETPIRYLDTERKGKSHKGYFWVFGRPEDDVCFDWTLGRGKQSCESIVSEFQGLLQSDGYAVYDRVCEGREIVQLGCWAHARRKFYDAWKNGEAEAVGYARNQWSKLVAYINHGQTRIDNNLTEQAIRPCKFGAKNWLFVGSPTAGRSRAIIYTILESCRRRGIEPMAYLNEMLERLPSMTNFETEALTPKNWKKAQVKTD